MTAGTDGLTRTTATLGAMVAALGTLVVLAWLLRWEQVLRVHPSLPVMQFNTAILFIATGAGLIAGARESRRGQAWLGGLILLLAIPTFLQFPLDRSLGIDTLLWGPLHGIRGVRARPDGAEHGRGAAVHRDGVRRRPDRTATADEHSTIAFANRAATAMFGYEDGALVEQPLTALMPASYRAGHTTGVARFLATGQSRVFGQSLTLEGLRQDGTVFPLDLSISTWEVRGERYFTGIILDVTARKDAEEQIRQSLEPVLPGVDDHRPSRGAAGARREPGPHQVDGPGARVPVSLGPPVGGGSRWFTALYGEAYRAPSVYETYYYPEPLGWTLRPESKASAAGRRYPGAGQLRRAALARPDGRRRAVQLATLSWAGARCGAAVVAPAVAGGRVAVRRLAPLYPGHAHALRLADQRPRDVSAGRKPPHRRRSRQQRLRLRLRPPLEFRQDLIPQDGRSISVRATPPF